jgi:hypothetical protein
VAVTITVSPSGPGTSTVTTTGTVSTTGSAVGAAQAARVILAMMSSEAIVNSLVRIFSSEFLVKIDE